MEIEYSKARERVAKELKSDNVSEVIRNTTVEAVTRIILRSGGELKYTGKISTDIYKFIFKKRYCKDEMPDVIDNYAV